MIESLKRYLYCVMHQCKDKNPPMSEVKKLLTIYGQQDSQQYFTAELEIDQGWAVFYFTNDESFNKRMLLESCPGFFEKFGTVIVPEMDVISPLKYADFMNAEYWREIMHEVCSDHLRDPSMLRYARTNPACFTMSFPAIDSLESEKRHYNLKIYNQPHCSPNLENETKLMAFAKLFFGTMLEVYGSRVGKCSSMPKPIKEVMQQRIYNLSVIHNQTFGLPKPSPLKSAEPEYTAEELKQIEEWKRKFNEWWDLEGHLLRAGGGEYEKSFAWAAWLNRERSKQKRRIAEQAHSI